MVNDILTELKKHWQAAQLKQRWQAAQLLYWVLFRVLARPLQWDNIVFMYDDGAGPVVPRLRCACGQVGITYGHGWTQYDDVGHSYKECWHLPSVNMIAFRE